MVYLLLVLITHVCGLCRRCLPTGKFLRKDEASGGRKNQILGGKINGSYFNETTT